MTWQQHHVPWSREEIERLHVLFAYASPAELQKAFPLRTLKAIYAKASTTGAKRSSEYISKIRSDSAKEYVHNFKSEKQHLILCLREAGALLRKQQHQSALDIIERGLARTENSK